ncbi:unnamed protein product, partial [Polarella glacialis]
QQSFGSAMLQSQFVGLTPPPWTNPAPPARFFCRGRPQVKWILPGSRPRLRRPVARAVHSFEGHPPEDTQPSAMQRVLVVGGGCTGACAAMLLRKKLGPDASIEIWEKARGFGGRMTTTRQDVAGETIRADVGAQYLSADLSDPTSKELIDMLLTRKVVAEVGGEKGPGAKGLCSTPERVLEQKRLEPEATDNNMLKDDSAFK